jgi:hypothetical protein
MGQTPRMISNDYVYSITQRAVDRTFLFLPNIEVKNIIGSSAARAMLKHPVNLFWLDYNINHEHMGIGPVSDSPEDFTHMIRFVQTFHQMVAVSLNKLYTREGAVFGAKSHHTPCLDNESAFNQLLYSMTNPVKDNLVDKMSHWKGFSSYNYLAKGEAPKFTFIDNEAYNKRKNKKTPKTAFTKIIYLHFSPLPSLGNYSKGKQQSILRKAVREKEQYFRDRRTSENKKVAGIIKLNKLTHRDRPKTEPEKSKKPICHTSDINLLNKFKQKLKFFIDAYLESSKLYRNGHFHVQFPRGSLRPPLIESV